MEHLDLLIRNRELFKEIKMVALDQEQMILNDKIDGFMNLALKRKKIREEISSNIRRYRKILEKNEKLESVKGGDSLSREIADVIRSIQETDKRIEELLKSNRDRFFVQIQSFKRSKGALKGYRAKGQKRPRFIDQRG